MAKQRVEKSCSNCGCYYMNVDGEVKEVMDNAQIECSLEQDMRIKPCRFWEKENKGGRK